jgi:hypothetical protein
MSDNNQPGGELSGGLAGAIGAGLAKMNALTIGVWGHLTRSSATPEPRPAVYAIDCDKRIVSVRFANQLTTHDIAGYAAALRRDPAFDPQFAEIVDMREVDDIELDAKQALSLADEIDPFSLASKRAFVTQKSGHLNVVRLHALLRGEDENIRVFGSMEEAERWVEM